MLIFGTLGPAGSNHDWVARRYLAFQGLNEARIELFSDFDAAFEAMLGGDIDHVLQVAVHPSVTQSVARYRGRAHLIDTFISPSQPMAVLTRAEIDRPTSLGTHPATTDYVDCARWETIHHEDSTIAVAQGLLEGKFHSGITLMRFAQEHPAIFRIDAEIGAVVDPWLVYGRDPICENGILAWPDSPAAAMYRRES